MLKFIQYTDADIKYTQHNIKAYGKELSSDQRKVITKKYGSIKSDHLNFLSRTSILIEFLLYLFILLGIVTAFSLWANSSESGNNQTTFADFLVGFFIYGAFVILLLHLILVTLRYRNYERYIQKDGTLITTFSKRSITWVGYKMTTSWIERYENNITGAVYFGAGLLVVTVGFRGLGEKMDTLGFPFPHFLMDSEGALKLGVIFVALFMEFALLLLLAVVTFFKDEAEGKGKVGECDTTTIESLLALILEAIKSFNGSFDVWGKANDVRVISIDSKLSDVTNIKNLLSDVIVSETIVSENGDVIKKLKSVSVFNDNLKVINLRLDITYLNRVFKDLINLLNTVAPKNVVDISIAVGKIQTAVKEVSELIKDQELKSQMEAFNDSIKKIKDTLGIALVKSGNETQPKIEEENNETQPNTNQ